MASGTLSPITGTALATGIGAPCPGLFRASIDVGGETQEVFATFSGDTLLFSSFLYHAGSFTYDSFYGVGLKQVAANG